MPEPQRRVNKPVYLFDVSKLNAQQRAMAFSYRFGFLFKMVSLDKRGRIYVLTH